MPPDTYSAATEPLRAIAVYEAGKAVLLTVLHLGAEQIRIGPDGGGMPAGEVWRQDEYPVDAYAETLADFANDTFRFRHAVAYFGGVQAVRLLLPQARDEDLAEDVACDYRYGADEINMITGDEASIDLYFQLAQRRCELLVRNYAPEIKAVALALLRRKKLTGDQVRETVADSLLSRRGLLGLIFRMRW